MLHPIIMKFGGTSVGDAEQMQRVAKLVVGHGTEPVVVVVSAMAGVTDMLISLTESLKDRSVGYAQLLGDITERHMRAVAGLQLDPAERTKLRHRVIELLHQLEQIIEDVTQASYVFQKSDYDRIVSFGERFSIELVAAAISHAGRDARAVEATELIVTSDRHGDAEPQLDESRKKSRDKLGSLIDQQIVPVVTGFIGATKSGQTTTLGRGASDYTATILGYCLDAREVWIWTDVTGVLTADPKLIPEAKTINHLSYEEAAELSYFGAKVLHHLTIVPASIKNIPIRIKNTFDQDNDGTLVSGDAVRSSPIKAVTAKHNLSLVSIKGTTTLDVPRVGASALLALADKNIDIYLISHASSESHFSLVIDTPHSDLALSTLRSTLHEYLESGAIDAIHIRHDVSMVAVVGSGVQQSVGITGRLFSALGAKRIDVIAVAQGQFESNVSCVINTADTPVAIKSLHEIFNLVGERSPWRPLKKLLRRS